MAQSTGCESTELHAEEETTPRDGAMPRRTSSRDSETTIVESVFTSLDYSTMANATKKQLVDELRARGLRCSGRKDELIARVIRDNITRQALEPTDSSTKDQAAYDDDRQAHLETLSADNARLCTEVSSLRAQLNRATTSERETLHEAHQNASLPTKRVTTPTLGLHHYVPADVTMSPGSTRPPSLNDGTNQDAPRPAAPTVSTHKGEPFMPQILAALVNTQALHTNTLSSGPPTTSPIQIHYTSDTSSSIPLFDGTPRQSKRAVFLHSTGGTLPIVSGTANNRPVRVCIDSGTNLFIMSANALTDDILTHAWVSRENIEVITAAYAQLSLQRLM
ncbi:hypothetical protein HPB51_028280 [Rhipicephalus microplus]|uniref:SAP domain-containing protein n=1 Tax=Rhipicephalus microplus TaxID=6941 RepID=A0A9J6CYA1_RHIMP|nr:hypothetical protein HPB51_028280 [Rhipicephalus microplus]